jgi:hypothetical protein
MVGIGKSLGSLSSLADRLEVLEPLGTDLLADRGLAPSLLLEEVLAKRSLGLVVALGLICFDNFRLSRKRKGCEKPEKQELAVYNFRPSATSLMAPSHSCKAPFCPVGMLLGPSRTDQANTLLLSFEERPNESFLFRS